MTEKDNNSSILERRRFLIQSMGMGIAISLFPFEALSAKVIPSKADALNLAARQRMLIYKTMRDYLLVALGINYKNPKEALKKDEMLFNETQKDLMDTFKEKNIQELIKKSSQEYAQIVELAKKPFDKKNSKEYLFLAEKAFDTANAVVQAISKTLNQKSSDGIEKAGALRAMAEKINMIYLIRTFDSNSPEVKKEMQNAMALFRKNLDILNKLEMGDSEIKSKIKKLEHLYLYFDTMNKFDTFQPVIITKKAEKMLKTANDLTNLYIKKSK